MRGDARLRDGVVPWRRSCADSASQVQARGIVLEPSKYLGCSKRVYLVSVREISPCVQILSQLHSLVPLRSHTAHVSVGEGAMSGAEEAR